MSKNNCTACECGVGLKGLGFDCTPELQVAYKLVATPTLDSTGARNKIPFSQALNQAYFAALINQTDESKRWNPLPAMKNIDDKRGDNKVFEFDDQTTEFLAEGARKFIGMIPGTSGSGANSPQMKALIEKIRCGDYSFYVITVKNQLIGKLSSDGLSLEPIEIDEQSISSMFVKKTNTTPQHLLVSFNWSQIEQDENLRMFDCNELGGANLQGLRGIFSASYNLLDLGIDHVTIQIITAFGTGANPDTVDGLVLNDFISSDDGAVGQIFNETDNANVAITLATENPDGTYKLDFAPQDITDVLIPYAKKDGYEFSDFLENPIDVTS